MTQYIRPRKKMTMTALKNIRIVLIEPSHPGNIGATARSMKTMGLENLYLVRPKRFPNKEANTLAAAAEDVLTRAHVLEDASEAIQDCQYIFGTTSRRRSDNWKIVTPRECAQKLFTSKYTAKSAILFGRESSGLTNQELDLCSYLIHIPANPEYMSLNLASAVQVVSYELYLASLQLKAKHTMPKQDIADSSETEFLYEHFEQVLSNIGFLNTKNPAKLMRKLRKMLNRRSLTKEEVQILRGILASIQKNVK